MPVIVDLLGDQLREFVSPIAGVIGIANRVELIPPATT
jgi:hypothetical protein